MFVKCISRKKQNLPIYPQKAGCTYIMKATNRDPIIISHRFMMNKSLPFSPTSLFQEHHWHRFCPGLTQLAFKCSLLYGFPLLYFPANVRNLCIFSVKKKNVSTREYFVCLRCSFYVLLTSLFTWKVLF